MNLQAIHVDDVWGLACVRKTVEKLGVIRRAVNGDCESRSHVEENDPKYRRIEALWKDFARILDLARSDGEVVGPCLSVSRGQSRRLTTAKALHTTASQMPRNLPTGSLDANTPGLRQNRNPYTSCKGLPPTIVMKVNSRSPSIKMILRIEIQNSTSP